MMAAIHAPAPAPTPPPPPHSHQQQQASSRSGSISSDVGDMIMALIPPPHAHHNHYHNNHTTAGSGGHNNNNNNSDSRKPFATPSTTTTTSTTNISTAFMNNRRCSISALFAATPTALSYNPDILDNLNFHSTSRPRRPSFSGTFNLNGIDIIPPSTLAEAQASLVGTDHLDSALECCNVYFPSFYELLEHYETVHVEIGRDIFSTLPKLDPIQEMDESGSVSAAGTMGAHGAATTTSTTTNSGMTNAFPSPALSHRSSTTTTTTAKNTHPNTVDPSGVSHIQEGLRHLRLEHPSANNNYLVPYSATATQNPQDPLPQTATTTKRPRTVSLNAANQPDEFKKVRSATTKAPALDCVPDSPIGGDFEPSRAMAIPVPSHPHSVPSHPHSVPSSGVAGTPPPVGGRGNGQTPITPPMDYHSPHHHHHPHPQHHGQEAASLYSPARSMHRHSHSHSAAFAIAPEVLHPQPRHRYPHPSAHADIAQQHNGSMPNISFLDAHPHLYDIDRSSTPQPHLSYSGAHLPVRPDSAPPVYAPNAEFAFLEGMYDHQFEHDFEYEYEQSLAGSSPMMSHANMHRNSPSVGPKSLHHPHMNMGMASSPSTSAATTTTGHTQQHVNDFSQHATIDPVTNKKQYKCPKPLCSKVYKNSNGLKYHLEHGNCEIEYTKPMHNGSSSTPTGVGNGSSTVGSSSPPHHHQLPFMYNTMNGVLPPLNMNLNGVNLSVPFLGDIKIAMRPYWCRVEGCGKKYKNLNGLKYHAKVVHPHMDFRKEVKGHASMGL